jgi:hypothetical protein
MHIDVCGPSCWPCRLKHHYLCSGMQTGCVVPPFQCSAERLSRPVLAARYQPDNSLETCSSLEMPSRGAGCRDQGHQSNQSTTPLVWHHGSANRKQHRGHVIHVEQIEFDLRTLPSHVPCSSCQVASPAVMNHDRVPVSPNQRRVYQCTDYPPNWLHVEIQATKIGNKAKGINSPRVASRPSAEPV